MQRGRPSFKPTDEQRKLVKALSGYGVPQEQICLLIQNDRGKPIASDTLAKAFRPELNAGMATANSKVAEALFVNATKNGNVTAQIFWMKTRAGWKEPKEFEAPPLETDSAIRTQAQKIADSLREMRKLTDGHPNTKVDTTQAAPDAASILDKPASV